MLVGEGLFAAVAVVLVAGGIAKLADPDPTRRMLSVLGLSRSDLVAHVLAGIEVAVGIIAIAFGGRLIASSMAVLYAGMAVVMAVLVARSDGSTSCGCFGRYSRPPSVVHIAVDILCCAVAVAAACIHVEGVVDYWSRLAVAGLFQVILVMGVASVLAVGMIHSPGHARPDARNVSRSA